MKKVNKINQQQLLLELCQAFTVVKNNQEAAQLLADLLSTKELKNIAKRLQIAKLLIKGLTYEKIKEQVGASTHTIARVNFWLQQSGEGYRLVMEKIKGGKDKKTFRKEPPEPFSWSAIKRQYPSYFWPQLLLENIIRNANKRQRKEISNVIKILKKTDQKNVLYKRIDKILKHVSF